MRKKIQMNEDRAFELEIKQMVVDSVEHARLLHHVPGRKGMELIRLPPSGVLGTPPPQALPDSPGPSDKLKFVARRGGGKFTVKPLDVPETSKLRQALIYKNSRDEDERQKIKKFVIDSVDRSRIEERTNYEMQLRKSLYRPPVAPPSADEPEGGYRVYSRPYRGRRVDKRR
eukprot:GHVO01017730.1.p1 GENE.GHVO01017730.1~~GHVO01017730.1.p1  ORF type:complete len:172 (+),score=40.74 GHVO01017730.1:298-813(+)